MNAINNLDKIIYFILEYNYKYQFENINKNKIQLELIVISPYLRIELINHDNRLSVVNVTNFDCDNCKNQIAGIDCLTSSFLPENINFLLKMNILHNLKAEEDLFSIIKENKDNITLLSKEIDAFTDLYFLPENQNLYLEIGKQFFVLKNTEKVKELINKIKIK